MKPLGLSAQMRWDRTVNRAVLPQPVPTRQHGPFLRVLLIALAIAIGISVAGVFSGKPHLPGASPEIEAAFQRGLQAGQQRQQCTWKDVFEARK